MPSNSNRRRSRTRRTRRMEPVYVKRRQRGLAVLIASLLLIVFTIIYVASQRVFPTGNSTAYAGNGNGVVQMVEIKEGSTVSELGPELVNRGIVKSNSAFQTAANSSTKASAIEPGFYRLQGEMSAAAAIAALVNPANKVEALDIVGGATLMDINVVGGQTRYGIYSQISKVTCYEGSRNCINAQDLQNIAATTDPAELGVPDWALDAVRAHNGDPRRLEGLIVPGQYMVNPEHDARAVLTELITKSATAYNNTGIVERAQGVGLSPYQLITAASLVEREAPAGEFDKVARVILNRLKAPMKLEFDSTVNYGLTSQEVATTDEDRKRVTPWNTYAKEGLPDTPIASPSIQAIEAVENPAQGNWLFFVTIDKKGTTVFNDTYEAHLRDTQQAISNGVLDSNR